MEMGEDITPTAGAKFVVNFPFTSRSGRSSLWIDATYAREMENLWTTFFIVMWLPLCGIMFFLGLVCLGLCLEELSTYLLVGGRLKGQEVLRFGIWYQFAFFGVFGMRKILGVSKTLRTPYRILLPCSFICCIFRQ
jgi:hypothetical protein